MHDHTKNQTSKRSISLVLPAWNEAEIISEAIAEADAALSGLADCYEIIVVDDGSTDETASIVQRIATTNSCVKLIRHETNKGYGASLRSGFGAACMDLVTFTDADCQFDLTELDRFVLLSRRYDVVCGYRIDRKDSALRCFYSRTYNAMVRLLLGTGVRDVDCALKMFHSNSLKKLSIVGDGFLVNSEILVEANRHNLSVVEVGVSHRPRTAGTSTVSIGHIPKVLVALIRYWWNDVQFPGKASRKNDTSVRQIAKEKSVFDNLSSRWFQIGLIVVAALFMLLNLSYPLIDRDETRYAEIPREMLATGNWILPQLNFQPYYDKPPLLYWLVAISFKLFGINETSARIVPALAALSTIAATMWFGNRNFSRRIGLLSGLVLLVSVGFAFSSRYLLLDGVLAFLVCMSLVTAYESVKGQYNSTEGVQGTDVDANRVKMGWWILSAMFVGLGFLTKGPIAIVLWLPPVFIMAWLSRSFARPRIWHYGFFGVIVTTIVAPWFVAVSYYDSSFVTEFFVTHNVNRFAGQFHAKPIWFFIPVALLACHPWSFLTIPYIRFLFTRSSADAMQRPPVVGYAMLWGGWCFAFFSLSSCKLPTYLLPAAPAMALMVGHYLDQVLKTANGSAKHWFSRHWSPRSAIIATSFAGVGLSTFAAITQSDTTRATFIWPVIWGGLLVWSLTLIRNQDRAQYAWSTSTASAFLLTVMLMHQIVPSYSRSQTVFGATSPLFDELMVESQSSIATIEHEFSEVPFYLHRDNIAHYASLSDTQIDQFLRENASSLLVVDYRVSAEAVRERIPEICDIASVGRRGPAVIYRVTTPQSFDQAADRKAIVR